MNRLFPVFLIASLLFSSCNNPSANVTSVDFETELQENINKAKEGDVIELPEGKFALSRTLIIKNGKNLTLRGMGKDKTILDFQTQKEVSKGIEITSRGVGVVLENFAVLNTHNSAISVEKMRGITLRGLLINWNKPIAGSSGVSVNECANSLIEDCEVSNAPHAGIEMTLCSNLIVRKNNLHNNTVGIEIESCMDADINDNTTAQNAIGIIVSHTPTTAKKNIGRYRIFNNRIENNNAPNKAITGTLASEVPAGTGLLLLAANHVDAVNNTINGHKTTSIVLLSYLSLGKAINQDGYDAYCSGINVHDNKINRDSATITPTGAVGKLFINFFANKIPDIIYDGYFNPLYLNGDGSMKDDHRICIHANGGCTFTDMDLPGKGAHRANNTNKYECNLPGLNEVKLN